MHTRIFKGALPPAAAGWRALGAHLSSLHSTIVLDLDYFDHWKDPCTSSRKSRCPTAVFLVFGGCSTIAHFFIVDENGKALPSFSSTKAFYFTAINKA